MFITCLSCKIGKMCCTWWQHIASSKMLWCDFRVPYFAVCRKCSVTPQPECRIGQVSVTAVTWKIVMYVTTGGGGGVA